MLFSSFSFPGDSVKNLPAMWETWVWSLGWEDTLEEGMATHASFLAWRTPGTEEPCGLQSMGSQRVRHDWATKHIFLFVTADTFISPSLITLCLFQCLLVAKLPIYNKGWHCNFLDLVMPCPLHQHFLNQPLRTYFINILTVTIYLPLLSFLVIYSFECFCKSSSV